MKKLIIADKNLIPVYFWGPQIPFKRHHGRSYPGIRMRNGDSSHETYRTR